jgi:hypothetical protein
MMRRHRLVLCLGVVWAASVIPRASAQSPELFQSGVFAGSAMPPALTEPVAPLPIQPANGPERLGETWGMDLVFGLPTGLRVQGFLGSTEGSGPVVEGFAGLYAIFPMIGGGFRWQGKPWCGAHDALIISPGIDANLLINPLSYDGWFGSPRHVGSLFGTDLDCLWRHRYGSRCTGDLGLKLGVGFAGFNKSVVVPIAGVFGGFRF